MMEKACVDKIGVDEMGVDKMGSTRNCVRRGGLVVERQTPEREVVGLIPTQVSVLCL